jgi:hypothetical protein
VWLKEEKMDYGKILKRAVEITWRHRALWLFGFLLALFGGGWGGGGGQGIQYRIDQAELARPEWAWGLVLLVLVVVFVLVILAVVLNNISRGALIGMVREVEETGNTSVRSGWHSGRSRLWSLISIDLVTAIPAFIAAMTLMALALSPLLLLLAERDALTALGIMLTVVLSLAVVLVLVVGGTALGIVREFAYRQCVLESIGVWRSVREAYRMVRANLRHVGLMWLVLFGIDLAASVIALPLALVGFGLAAGAGAAVYAASQSIANAMVVGLMLALPTLLVMAAVGGVYLVFRSAAWTLAYRELPAQSSLA